MAKPKLSGDGRTVTVRVPIAIRRRGGRRLVIALRKTEASKIDSAAAELFWCYGQIMDPYGLDPNPPKEYDCIGRIYFAKAYESDTWVCVHDPLQVTRKALESSGRSKLAFPARPEDLRELPF